jgi:hypothetical protein
VGTRIDSDLDTRPTLPAAPPTSRDWLVALVIRGVLRVPTLKTPGERAFWLLGFLLAHAGLDRATADRLLQRLRET